MDKKKLRKRKKRVISAMVIATAFVVCILATFGVTMAYFGGKSGADTSTLTLKTAVWVNATSTTTATGGYVVPSQAINRTCEVKVKSANKANGDAVTDGNKGSDSLLRATITWSVGEGITLTGSSETSYGVKIGGATVAKLMKWTKDKGGDDNWYLVDSNTATMSGSATMYTIKSSTGEKTLTYDMTMVVPETITNSTVSDSDASREINVTIQYTVIQADFYGGSTSLIAKTVSNAKAIFDSDYLDDSASY